MSLRTSLLKAADRFRKISGPDFADIRINQLTVRTRTWSGSVVGEGTYTDSDLVLPARYPVRAMTQQDVFGDAGRYELGDIYVNHITPSDGAGTGYTKAQLLPDVTTNNVEIIHVITGPDGGNYRCIDFQNYRPFSIRLVLRRLASSP